MMHLKVWVVNNEVTTVQTSDMKIDWLTIEPTTDALIFDAEMDCDYCDASDIISLIKFDGKQLTGLDFKAQSFIEWKAPIIPPEQLAAAARAQRDSLLASTDWTQLPDVPQATREAYAVYRQALRDVPEQDGFPTDIIWPSLGE